MRTSLLLGALAAAFAAAPALAADPPGKSLFLANCSACHKADATGVKGAFPALAGDPFVVGPKVNPVTRVLNGRGGMPSFKADLSDEQIASILTYVRSSFGNHADAVLPAEVAAVRKGGAVAAPRGLQAH